MCVYFLKSFFFSKRKEGQQTFYVKLCASKLQNRDQWEFYRWWSIKDCELQYWNTTKMLSTVHSFLTGDCGLDTRCHDTWDGFEILIPRYLLRILSRTARNTRRASIFIWAWRRCAKWTRGGSWKAQCSPPSVRRAGPPSSATPATILTWTLRPPMTTFAVRVM